MKQIKICDLELIHNIGILFERTVILYGASKGGEEMFHTLQKAGIKVEAFCDSDIFKWGNQFMGLSILSIWELKEIDNEKDIIVIISSCFTDEILATLNKYQIGNGSVYSRYGLQWGIHFGFEDSRINNDFRTEYQENNELMKAANYILGRYFDLENDGLNRHSLFEMLFNESLIMVFQPCKVGSATVEHSLLSNGINAIHLHDIEGALQRIDLSKDQYDMVRNKIQKKRNIKIITMVREPIARDISCFFQLMDLNMWRGREREYRNMYDFCLEYLSYNIKIKKNLPSHNDNWHYYINRNIQYGAIFDWFDLEIKKIFDVDIYEYPFNREEGYSIIKKDNIEILLMRTENINNLENVIGEFTNCRDFRLQNINLAEDKAYKYAYEELKEKIKLPEEYVDFYYKDNPRMDYFYSQQEKEKFLEKWKSNIDENIDEV